MKTLTFNKKILLATAVALISTSLLASGSHSSGHGTAETKGHDMSMQAHWASPKEAMAIENPIKSDHESIAQGSAIFQRNCVSCHGKTAEGDGPSAAFLSPKPTNLKLMAGGHPDGDFAWKIQNGRGAMPAWKSILSQNDVWNTVNYIQSLKQTAKSHGGSNHSHN